MQDKEKAISLIRRVRDNDLFKQEVTLLLEKMSRNETI